MAGANPKHPNGEVITIENDYVNNGITDSRHPKF